MFRVRAAFAAVAVGFALTLAGCTATVSLDPAPDANDPACAEVMVRLPQVVADQDRRWTDAQATAAWGDPASVIVTCGVAQLGPTAMPCTTVADVDWVIDDSAAPSYRLTSFNRIPAVEVYLNNEDVSSLDVLDRISPSVALLAANGSECSAADGAG